MPDGFINVLKPSFMTSSDVVVKVRGILKKHYGEKVKVGHLGTLDPGGAGVLPVAIGKGARLFPYTDDSVKVYRAGFKFGVETDTLDSFGKVTKTCDKIPTKEEILTVLPKFKVGSRACGRNADEPAFQTGIRQFIVDYLCRATLDFRIYPRDFTIH